MFDHMFETGHGSYGGNASYFPCGPGHVVKKTIEMCKWCGKEKNPEKTLAEKIDERLIAEAAAKES